jgi:hypothetical protein
MFKFAAGGKICCSPSVSFAMKKFLSGILAIFYLSTSMGASVHLHYCMGKLISWGFVNHENPNCDYCGMPKFSAPKDNQIAKKGCCSDEHKLLKTDKDQKLPFGEFEFLKQIPDVISLQLSGLSVHPVSSGMMNRPVANAPPDTHKNPLFLRYCNFRI